MAKLILEMQTSLDGFMAGPQGQTDWMVWNWGPEWTWDKTLQDFHTNLTRLASHILISRQMAEEGFTAHWKQAAAQNNEQSTFAEHISKTPKIVISTTLTKDQQIPGGWNETLSIEKSIDFLEDFKHKAHGTILVYGGATLVSSLLEKKYIDELYLVVNPVAIGEGLNVFNSIKYFQLIDVESYQSGIAVLHYELQK